MDEPCETQVSLSDPDARSMATTARMPRIVGCNVQTAVEACHHLIVTHDATMLGFDRDEMSMLATAAQDEMTTDPLTAIADKGYYKSEEIVASEDAGISVAVPKPMTSNAAARGPLVKADFAYVPDEDVCVCPAGEHLTFRFTCQQDGKAIRFDWSGGCAVGNTKMSVSGPKHDWTRPSTTGCPKHECRASIPQDLIIDGCRPRQNETSEERGNRDGSACAGLHYDPCQEAHGHSNNDRSR